MEWQRGDEWIARHRRPYRESSYTLTCTGRRQRVAIGDGDGDSAAPTVTLSASSQHGRERRCVDIDVGLDRGDLLRRIRRLERLRGHERIKETAALTDDDQIHNDVHGRRRLCSAVRHRDGRGRAATGTATLSWAPPTTNTNGTPVTPLSGYTLYYGTSPGALTQSVAVGSSTTSYTITGLAAGAWYFAVAADAADGTQSAMSNVGSKTI